MYQLQYIDGNGFVFAYRTFQDLRSAMDQRAKDVRIFVVKHKLSLKIVEV
jgi:hypothetical protein